MPSPPAAARLDALAQTRELIVRASRDIVAEEGWAGAQVALIAARAQVATGSVYRYFESKAALFTEVLAIVSKREIDILREHIDGKGTATQRLGDAIGAFVRRAMKSRRLAYALIAEPCDREIDEVRLVYRAAISREFARVVKEGIGTGEFLDVDVNIAASCVTGALIEGLTGPLVPETKPDSKAAERVAATIVQLCVRMVSITAAARRSR